MLWNQFDTKGKDGMTCEVIDIKGWNGDTINAYVARPGAQANGAGIVLLHHMPGWDEYYRETARRYAQHGYLTIAPNLYYRLGNGTPDDATAQARAAGGSTDDSVTGDAAGARDWLKANGASKIGITGTCSAGRYTFLVACRDTGYDAAVELWGGGVAGNGVVGGATGSAGLGRRVIRGAVAETVVQVRGDGQVAVLRIAAGRLAVVLVPAGHVVQEHDTGAISLRAGPGDVGVDRVAVPALDVDDLTGHAVFTLGVELVPKHERSSPPELSRGGRAPSECHRAF